MGAKNGLGDKVFEHPKHNRDGYYEYPQYMFKDTIITTLTEFQHICLWTFGYWALILWKMHLDRTV